MSLSEKLDEYGRGVSSWLDGAKKETAAVQKLQKAVATGNMRQVEALRQAALTAAKTVAQRAGECGPLEFDTAEYLAPGGGYLEELEAACAQAGVQLFERDGVIFCYPSLVRVETDMGAVRSDRKLEFQLRPETLAALLKKAQGQNAKAKPQQFIETLFEAYELVRSKLKLDTYTDVALTRLHEVLTLLPGSDREYTLLDFTRDIYFLDTSDVTQTRKGFRISLPASTVSRERSVKILKFVTRDGYEKQYAAIKFTPGE